MKIGIVTPRVEGLQSKTGNLSTAERWAGLLRSLGHDVDLLSPGARDVLEVLVVLHGVKGFETLQRSHRHSPDTKRILALSGTDLYPSPPRQCLQSMEIADALVALQPKALDQIPQALRHKATVIMQAVSQPHDPAVSPLHSGCRICVAGHLRDVKDPMLAAQASRHLPTDSQIEIHHAGAILDPKYHALVTQETATNPRYHYHGELSQDDLHRLMRSCQATLLTSRSEGGPAVIGESIVRGTPVLATRIDGVTGLLGDDYPGLFPVGEAEALASLLDQFERDEEFRAELRALTRELAGTFSPERERAAWADLLAQVFL
jgi:putative glycosyltransferase (TIGR04348 family)